MYYGENILVVEDDPDIAELLSYNLQKNGYRITLAMSGTEAMTESTNQNFDLIILDIMLPGIDGLSVLKKFRQPHHRCYHSPVLMLTAKSEESDIVVGLELGADDYLTKPFSPKELVARVRALLRRKPMADSVTPLVQDPSLVAFDDEKHECFVRGKPLSLTLAEYKLLQTLVSKPGRVFTRDQLLEKMTGGEVFVIDRNVDVHVRAIRKKLDTDSDILMTVRGVGYKYRDHHPN